MSLAWAYYGAAPIVPLLYSGMYRMFLHQHKLVRYFTNSSHPKSLRSSHYRLSISRYISFEIRTSPTSISSLTPVAASSNGWTASQKLLQWLHKVIVESISSAHGYLIHSLRLSRARWTTLWHLMANCTWNLRCVALCTKLYWTKSRSPTSWLSQDWVGSARGFCPIYVTIFSRLDFPLPL